MTEVGSVIRAKWRVRDDKTGDGGCEGQDGSSCCWPGGWWVGEVFPRDTEGDEIDKENRWPCKSLVPRNEANTAEGDLKVNTRNEEKEI
jgi:hypothetical protein